MQTIKNERQYHYKSRKTKTLQGLSQSWKERLTRERGENKEKETTRWKDGEHKSA